MSRPYFKIQSMSYSTPVLTMNYTFHKLRGGGTISVAGLSSSFSFFESNSNSSGEGGSIILASDYNTKTFSMGTLGTSSTATYNAPTPRTFTFTGTVSFVSVAAGTNTKISLAGVNLLGASGVTASIAAAGGGATLSNYITQLYNNLSFSGAATGFTAVTASVGTSSVDSLIFSAPANTGDLENDVQIVVTKTTGASSFATASSSTQTFGNGSTTYNLVLSYPRLGGGTTFSYTETNENS